MTNPLFPSALMAPMFSSAAMRAIVADEARLQRMLDVEAALARAEAGARRDPASAAKPIADACKAKNFDIKALGRSGDRGRQSRHSRWSRR